MNVNGVQTMSVTPKPVSWSGGSPPWGGGGIGGARQRMGGAIDASAQLFGMSSDELTKTLSGGKSLLDVASSKGVGQSTLLSTIQQAITSTVPSGAQVPGDAAAKIAQRIASHHRQGAVGAATATAGAAAGLPTTKVVAAAGAAGSTGSDPDGDGDNDHGASERYHAYL